MSLYPGLASVVADVVADTAAGGFGGPIVFRRASGTYDPATDTTSAGELVLTTSAVQATATKAGRLDAALAAADELVSIAPRTGDAFLPDLGDRVTWRGEAWRVVARDVLAPDGATVVLVTLGLGR